ncbi:hypothetical protein DERF_006717 [Dermatophagoides farinae]|uniref:Uncharacterized protein n=1 Tax=Dermatophagoides farinae TaxID=6954 RepID=A0A922HWR0_DERFA|nr:hypothetical protein DERF_006717 [Dermatophagoides farinae]
MSRQNFRKNNKFQTSKRKLEPNEFDLEKARHEVFNLGIKGFSDKDKRTAKRELAIRLGATPKKPRGKNIQQHLQEVRERKQREREEREQQQQNHTSGTTLKRKKQKPQPKKKGLNEVRGMDYQLGRFRDGVQYLSRQDIEKITKNKRLR